MRSWHKLARVKFGRTVCLVHDFLCLFPFSFYCRRQSRQRIVLIILYFKFKPRGNPLGPFGFELKIARAKNKSDLPDHIMDRKDIDKCISNVAFSVDGGYMVYTTLICRNMFVFFKSTVGLYF